MNSAQAERVLSCTLCTVAFEDVLIFRFLNEVPKMQKIFRSIGNNAV